MAVVSRMPQQYDHQVTVEYMFGQQRRSAGRVKGMLDEALLQQRQSLACGDTVSDTYKRVQLLSSVKDIYESTVMTLDAVVGYINNATANGARADFDRHYAAMSKMYSAMEKAMRKMLQLPDDELGEMYEEIRALVCSWWDSVCRTLQRHPLRWGAAAGAVPTALLLHKYISGACVATTCAKAMGAGGTLGCGTVGWLGAAAFGALGGVLAVGLGLCVYRFFCPVTQQQSAELRPQQQLTFDDMRQAVEELKQKLNEESPQAVVQGMQAIAATWDILNDYDPQRDTDVCPVCLELPQQPMRFRGCLGRHWHCRACREACLRQRAATACPVCRAAPRAQ